MKSKHQNISSNHHHGLLYGALAAGVIGIGGALLLSPKRSKKSFGSDLYTTYCDFTEKAVDIKDAVAGQISDIKVIAKECSEFANRDNAMSIAGGVLGILVSIFLANRYLVTSDGTRFIHQAEGWIDSAKSMIELINKEIVEVEKGVKKGKKHSSGTLADVLDLTKRGLHIYNEFIKRR